MRTLLALAGLLAVAPAPSEIRLTPAEVAALPQIGAVAGTSGLAGVETRVLSGDPTKPGLFAIEIKVPPNTRIAAHSHKDERTATVISGMWHFGYGPKADDSLRKPLPPGSFYTEPAGVAHFARTGAEGAHVYITGYGPTDTVYAEPAGITN
ncbi:cupin domain-containing protein [Sphingomonas sp. LM7]|uniref:cupin domain-containing protein n=1 Tax=Sphingomonas sp. LM7 TaxID=1938607 RepID=UPI000983F510|nr:cupin domain-containing protein [Sphingomonas sp. LM7]AQR75246.1 hypothetical protein BXU08_17660 [Sphingomonas sp. LM7]